MLKICFNMNLSAEKVNKNIIKNAKNVPKIARFYILIIIN